MIAPVQGPIMISGHFGEWMQGQLGPGGPVALITLPSDSTGLMAWYRRGQGRLHLHGAGLSLPRARHFLRLLGVPVPAGHLRLRPLHAPGLGTGVSTASLVALARISGWQGRAPALAQACQRAEGASDPLMFATPERLLWGSRDGQSLARLPALPAYEILGGFLGPAQRTNPKDTDFPDIADLVQDWHKAQDLADFAALASASAARCIALRGPVGDPTPALMRELGALGWVAAHTGAARGLIFAPGTVPDTAGARLRAAGLRALVHFNGGGHSAGKPRAAQGAGRHGSSRGRRGA